MQSFPHLQFFLFIFSIYANYASCHRSVLFFSFGKLKHLSFFCLDLYLAITLLKIRDIELQLLFWINGLSILSISFLGIEFPSFSKLQLKRKLSFLIGNEFKVLHIANVQIIRVQFLIGRLMIQYISLLVFRTLTQSVYWCNLLNVVG